MPLYVYESIDRQGQTVKGDINAPSFEGALERLRERGLVVVDLYETSPTERQKGITLFGTKKVTLTDLAIFSRQLSAMISSGIPVTRAIATLAKQTANTTLADALENISRNVEGGMTLTDAFSQYPNVFNKLYISMISAGEVGGQLEATLLRLSNQLHKEKKLQDEIKSATSYPKAIGIFALCVFVGMLVFLVPTFEQYAGEDAPLISRFIFGLSASLRNHWFIWLLSVALIITAIVMFFKSKAGHALWENVKLKLPIFGPIISKSVIARFARTLATLVDGGIPIVQALQTAGPTSGSDLISAAVSEAIVRIEEGSNISTPLEDSRLFPPMVTHMIAIGEESGTLPAMLDKIAEFFEEDVETASKQLSSMLEPIILITIGVLVGGMLIALYLPMFSAVINSGLQ
ncbi:MAG: type II secretion system F family protein [Clostridiales bacterium]|nr:type II secretion system F family protein [Clostridiales bacterium]